MHSSALPAAPATALALLALLSAGARPAGAQSTAGDSAARAAPKPPASPDPFITGVYHPESYARGGAGGPDNRSALTGVYFPERPPPAADSTRTVRADSATSSTIVTLPLDLPVALACGKSPAGSQAAGLLSVSFSGGTEADHAAAAKQAGGVLAGRTAFGDGYVRVPAASGPASLVADRLIRMQHVSQVAPVSCPGPARVEAALRAARAAAPCAQPGDSSEATGVAATAPDRRTSSTKPR
jgi:hypothetical protein